MQIAPVKDFLLVAVKGDNCSAVVYVSKYDGFVFNDELFMILKSDRALQTLVEKSHD